MKRSLVFLLCFCVAVLPACQLLTPQQRSQAETVIETEYLNGNLTTAQRDAAIEAIRSGSDYDWEGLGLVGLNILLALVGGPMIVRSRLPVVGRGPATQRVGLSEEKLVRKAKASAVS